MTALNQAYRIPIDVKGRRKINNHEHLEFFATTNDAADGFVVGGSLRVLLRYN